MEVAALHQLKNGIWRRALDSYQFVFAQKAQNIFQFLCKPLVYSR
jgi:hypothetical protein